MPLLRDEIRDHSAEEMLFIRRAAIAFLLVVVCFGVLIVNLYHLQVEQHDFYQTRSNQNDIKMLPIAPSRGLIFDRNGIPLVQNITLYRLQVIPSKIPDMAALLQQLTPIVDLTPDDIASFRDDMHHTSRYKAVTLKSDLSDDEWLSKFGYGQSTGIDLNEEYAGVLPSREWKQRVHKKPWYQGDTISVGIGQGYWIATPIQMVKALTTLLNNGKVQDPHLLYSMKQGNHVERYQQPANLPQVGDPKSPYWGIVRNGMYGMANQPNGTGYKLFHTAPYQIAAKSGTSQVFSLKQNQTYNAKMIPVRLRDHIFYTLFAPYQHPKVAMALILENGGGDGVVAGPTARAILDHIFVPQQASSAAADVPQRDSADAQ